MPAETWIDPNYWGESNTRPLGRLVADLAERQHRVARQCQLQSLGAAPKAIDYRVKTGWWWVVHPGVYALGPGPLTRRGEWMAAVLSGGQDAVLSHGSAAVFWGLSSRGGGTIDVTSPTQHQLKGLRFRQATLPADEVTIHGGIPVTTVPRTLFDNAAVLSRHRFERLVQEAEFRRLNDPLSLPDLVKRYPGRRGVATIREVLADGHFGASITKEELELRFVEFLDRHSFTQPVLNGMLSTGSGTFEVDCHWSEPRLIVELDGRGSHLTARAFESDRARDRALSVAGWRVIRITWRQLHREEPTLAADLATLLGPAASGPKPP